MKLSLYGFCLTLIQAMAFEYSFASAEVLDSCTSVSTQLTGDQLFDLAKISFPDEKSEAFKDFFHSAEIGEAYNRIPAGVSSDFREVENWDPSRTICASWIRWLCTDPKAKSLVSPHGIDLRGVRIKTPLDLKGCQIPFPFMADDCVFDKEVVLEGAHLPSAEFHFCFVSYLWADGLKIDNNFSFSYCSTKDAADFMSTDLTWDAIVRIAKANIGGYLAFEENNSAGLILDRSTIGGSVVIFLNDYRPMTLSIEEAKIGGDLDCAFSDFDVNPEAKRIYGPTYDTSIDARGVKVAGDLSFRSTEVDGEISLEGATIDRDLNLRDANLRAKRPKNFNPFSAPAVTATRASIGGSVLLEEEVYDGKLHFDNFQTSGMLAFNEATITGPFVWKPRATQKDTVLDLRHAKAGRLFNGLPFQLSKGHLLLDGFLFDRLDDDASADTENQLRWLRLQSKPGLLSQPYDQMATAFRNMGLPDRAIDILIAENWDHGRAFYPSKWFDVFDPNKLLALLWFRVLGPSIGYGYRPAYALWIFLFFLALGTHVFGNAARKGIIIRAKSLTDPTLPYPSFHPLIYSLETLIPLLKLGMGEYWSISDSLDKPILRVPTGLKQFIFCFLYGQRRAQHQLANAVAQDSGLLVRHYFWIHIICGWIATSIFLAGLSGLLRKN